MKSLALIVFILLSASGTSPGQNPEAEHLQSFDRVWQTVYENHFDPTFGGIDWWAVRKQYRPKIAGADPESIEEFIRITNDMLFELNLSHLLVASERMLKTYMPVLFAEGDTGVEVRWMQERLVVRTRSGFPGRTAGIRPGCIVTHIDGRNVGDIIQSARPVPPYNPRNYRGGISNFLMGHINGPPGTEVALTFLDGNDRPKTVVLARRSRGAGRVVSDAMPPVFVEIEVRRIEENVGYIRFNRFADPVGEVFSQTLETMRDTRGLIIDLRGNPGGYFKVVDALIAQLIAEPAPPYRFRFRDKTVERAINPSAHPYRQPVAVLIDAASTSSSEHFAACLQDIGRAVIVGERSPGYLLGAKWMRLPNGLSFIYPFVQPLPPKGRVIENNGVIPDIEVEFDRSALLKGTDSQIKAALAYILNQPE